MHDVLPIATVAEQLAKLRAAFPNTRDNRSPAVIADLYREHLAGISADVLRVAVERVIREDEFFPKIARLRGLAFEVEARRERERQSHAVAVAGDEQTCPNCQHAYRWARHWAPKMVRAENGEQCPVLTPDGQYFALIPTERMVCDCSARSMWWPVDGIEPPVAKADTLLKYHLDALARASPRPVVQAHLPALATA